MHVLQLSEPTTFEHSDPAMLFDKPSLLLGKLLKAQTVLNYSRPAVNIFVMGWGGVIETGTRFIGVVVRFEDLDHSLSKAIAPTQSGNDTRIDILLYVRPIALTKGITPVPVIGY